MSFTPGDVYLSTLSSYISTNSTRLASSPLAPSSRRSNSSTSSYSYTSYLLPASLYSTSPPKPLSLRLTPQNLFYLLLRFQAIGLDVGELDVPLDTDVQRAMSLVEQSGEGTRRRRKQEEEEKRKETGSFRSVAGSMVSGLSLGGWWGTASGGGKDPDSDLKLIYSAFTKLPSIVIHAAGLSDEIIEEMAGSGPLDTAVPLKVFKNLQVLEIISLPPSALIIPSSHILRSLTIRNVDSPLNDEEGEWLVPVLFGEKEGAVEQRRRERMVGPGGIRNRQPSAASAVMGGVGEDDEEQEQEGDASKLNVPSSSSNKPPPATLLPSPPVDSSTGPSNQQQLKFPHLSHLALPSLSLLTLPPLPVPSLVSLDLSHNLLLTLPPNLIHFPNLLALNLEGNMINSLRGADQLLPSSSSSSTSSPAPPPPSSFRNGSTPSRPPPGLKVLNLDSNRLSNLHGLSGLSSLQRLSLRNNSLSESLELSRLTALPILVDLYVLPNPFSTNPAEEDWRVRLWEGFAREGREETRCPKVDGEGVSWSEKRRMKVLFPTDGGAASRRASRAEMEVPRSPPIVPVGGGTASSQHVRKTSRTTTRERRVGSTMSVEEPAAPADLFSPTKPTQTSSSSSSPPPPFKARKPPLPPSSYHPPSGGSPNQPPSTTTTTPRRKRRHRRIVNLDGGEEDSGTATGTDLSGVSEDESVKPSNGKGSRVQHQHQRGTSERLVSKPAVVEAQDILLACPSSSSSPTKPSSSNDAPTPATPNHSSLRSPPTSTSAAARSSARRARVSASVYEPSPPSPPSGNTSGNGAGSGDEFRKKLEAMRMEVGDSWLRVLSAGERAGAGVAVAGGNKEGEVSGGGTKGKGGEEEVGAEGVESVTVGEGVAVTRVVKKKKKGKSKGKKGGLGG